MDSATIAEIFAEILPVRVRRMFGGHGIYDGGLMFALEADGELWLKTDAATRPRFEAAGSRPFIYLKQGKAMPMSYWRLPDEALDDPEQMRNWTALALSAAQQSAALKRPSQRPRAHPR